MLLVALADNLGVMWVALEATTLTSIFLVTFYGRATSLEAAWKYAVIGGVGLLVGVLGPLPPHLLPPQIFRPATLVGVDFSGPGARVPPFAHDTLEPAFVP